MGLLNPEKSGFGIHAGYTIALVAVQFSCTVSQHLLDGKLWASCCEVYSKSVTEQRLSHLFDKPATQIYVAAADKNFASSLPVLCRCHEKLFGFEIEKSH